MWATGYLLAAAALDVFLFRGAAFEALAVGRSSRACGFKPFGWESTVLAGTSKEGKAFDGQAAVIACAGGRLKRDMCIKRGGAQECYQLRLLAPRGCACTL